MIYLIKFIFFLFISHYSFANENIANQILFKINNKVFTNIDFKRNSYSEEALKPQDIMTVMFSFKNLGSYKSTNLAVSENDKQDIEWESISVNNDLFN